MFTFRSPLEIEHDESFFSKVYNVQTYILFYATGLFIGLTGRIWHESLGWYWKHITSIVAKKISFRTRDLALGIMYRPLAFSSQLFFVAMTTELTISLISLRKRHLFMHVWLPNIVSVQISRSLACLCACFLSPNILLNASTGCLRQTFVFWELNFYWLCWFGCFQSVPCAAKWASESEAGGSCGKEILYKRKQLPVIRKSLVCFCFFGAPLGEMEFTINNESNPSSK